MKIALILKRFFYVAFPATLCLTLLSLVTPKFTSGATTLPHFLEIAASVDEFSSWDFPDPLNPKYEAVFKEKFKKKPFHLLRQKVNYCLTKLRLSSPPLISFSYLEHLLQEVGSKCLHPSNPFIEGIKLTPSSRVIVFGRSHSSFHLLVRSLEKIAKMGLIDDDLCLSSDTYMIFLGGYLSRSQFDLETLLLLLVLQRKNPSTLILLRGKHEDKGFWASNTLGRALTLYCAENNRKTDGIWKDVSLFMSCQPSELYAFVEDASTYIQFSPSISDPRLLERLEQTNLRDLFSLLGKNHQASLPVPSSPLSTDKRNPKALLADINWREQYELNEGLILFKGTKSFPHWTLMSSQCEIARKALGFYFESFCTINCHSWPATWHLTLHSKDTKNGRDSSKIYNLFSGEEVAPPN